MAVSALPSTREGLDKLLFRLVMAEESRIESLIYFHLPHLLDMLSTTTDDTVRNKVVECCSHLIKRLRADSKLQVPCDILLIKARAPTAGAFTRNFALVFLEIGCPRLPPQGKSELGQALLLGLAAEGTSEKDRHYGRQQVALVHRLLEVLEFIQPPPTTLVAHQVITAATATTTAATATTAGSGNSMDVENLPPSPPSPSPKDLAFLLELFLDILLIPNASRLLPPSLPPSSSPSPPPLIPIHGLSHDALLRLSSHPSLWSSLSSSSASSAQSTLSKLKLHVLRLLHSPLFTYPASLPLLLIAATDSETRVKEKAESLVKLETDARATNKSSLPSSLRRSLDKELADRLLRLFLGGPSLPPALPRTLISDPMRIKLLEWGMREVPETLVEETGLCLKAALTVLTPSSSSSSSSRHEEGIAIRALGARLAAFVAVRCPPSPFALAGPLLLAAVKKVLVGCYQSLLLQRGIGGGGRGPERGREGSALDREVVLREGCYETLAALAHRMGGGAVHLRHVQQQQQQQQEEEGGEDEEGGRVGEPGPCVAAAQVQAQPQLLFSDPLLLRLLFEALASEGPVQAIKVAEALGASIFYVYFMLFISF